MNLCSSQHPRKKDSAWSFLVCFSGAFSLGMIFAFTQCYAIVMPVFIDVFKDSKSKTAWAGSIAMGLTFFAMPFSTMLINRTSFRVTAVLGSLMAVTSLIISSFTQNLLQLFFSYSLLYGLGSSLLFTSSIVAVTAYFDKRQAVGVGLLTAGQNIGTLTLGPVIQVLLDLYGWRWMYRIFAASYVVPIIFLMISYDPNVENVQENNGNEGTKPLGFTCNNILRIFRTPAYLIAVTTLCLEALTCFISYVHLISYCIEVNINPDTASQLFIAIGVSSLFSCIVCGRILDIKSVNPFHVNQVGALSMGLSMILIQFASQFHHFVIYSVFLGLGLGSFFTTVILLLLQTVDIRLSIVAMSSGQTLTSIGNSVGPPLVGFIADVKGSYRPAFAAAGGVMLIAFFVPFFQYCIKPWRSPPIGKLPVEVIPQDVAYDSTNGVLKNGSTNGKHNGGLQDTHLKKMNGDLPESHVNDASSENTNSELSNGIATTDVKAQSQEIHLKQMDGDLPESYFNESCLKEELDDKVGEDDTTQNKTVDSSENQTCKKDELNSKVEDGDDDLQAQPQDEEVKNANDQKDLRNGSCTTDVSNSDADVDEKPSVDHYKEVQLDFPCINETCDPKHVEEEEESLHSLRLNDLNTKL